MLKVSCCEAQFDVKGTVEALNKLLAIYPNDGSSWLALADIYLSQSNFEVTVFATLTFYYLYVY